jgi:helicase
MGAFFGLYVGIDRYDSPLVSNLASAVRDAKALHALFSDNLAGQHVLLADDDATTARLRHELRALQAKTTGDDFVVITFSGHGSDTHEIVSFDTDPFDIAGTGLPLDEFTELVSGVPARHLLVVLDCCFSGGAGAKVLHAPRRSRGGPGGLPKSTEAFMQQMVGTGRVILTASTAGQEAWEDPRLGHGYLTYYLLQALLGSASNTGSGPVVQPAAVRDAARHRQRVGHLPGAAGADPAGTVGRRRNVAGICAGGGVQRAVPVDDAEAGYPLDRLALALRTAQRRAGPVV